MNRLLISIIIVSMALVMTVVAFGQGQDGGSVRSREGRRQLQNLSPEERDGLRGRWQDMSERERKEFRARMRERFESGGQDIERGGQLKAYESQVEKLRAEHKESIEELKAIHDLAVEEKAKKTAKRLEKLIAKHQKEFRDRLQQLEQRRQRLVRTRRSDSKAAEFTLEVIPKPSEGG